jgi:predicted HicB family RNase H-like nuclease
MMEHKGYIGRVEFDDEAAVFHGEVINTRDVITFQGESVAELKQAFRDSVDEYLAYCAERGEEPDKPFSGQFVARVSPELHRRASRAASLAGKSLNAWVAEQLQSAVEVAAPVAGSRKTVVSSNGNRNSAKKSTRRERSRNR